MLKLGKTSLKAYLPLIVAAVGILFFVALYFVGTPLMQVHLSRGAAKVGRLHWSGLSSVSCYNSDPETMYCAEETLLHKTSVGVLSMSLDGKKIVGIFAIWTDGGKEYLFREVSKNPAALREAREVIALARKRGVTTMPLDEK